MMYQVWRNGFLWMAISLLAACGGGGEGEGDDLADNNSSPVASCTSLVFSSTTSAPLEMVRITGLSGAFLAAISDPEQPLYASFTPVDESASPVWAPLFIVENGSDTELDLAVPFSPETPYDNADYTLSITSGSSTCGGTNFTISGLTVTDASVLDTSLSALQALVLEKATVYGITTWDELQTAIADYVANGGNPTIGWLQLMMAAASVQQMQDYAGQVSASEKALLAAILNKLDYAGLTQARVDELALSTIPAQTTDSAALLSVAQARETAAGLKVSKQISASSDGNIKAMNKGVCETIVGDPVSINDAWDLNYYMEEQTKAQNSLEGDMGSLRKLGGAAMPVAGAVLGGPAGATVGILMYVEQTLSEYDTKALPSQFTNMLVDLDPGNSVNEDYEKAGKELFWKNARVWVKSEKWNLTNAAIDALAQAIGAGKAIKGLNEPAQTMMQTAGSVMGEYAQNEVFNKVKDLNLDAECLEVPEYSWGPIDISDEQWLEDQLVGESLSLGARLVNARALALQKLGNTEVIVKTKTGKFGGKQTTWNEFVEVKPIQVTFDPGYKKVETLGETIVFTVKVRDTEEPETAPSFDPLPAGFTLISGPTDLGGGNFEISLQTPTAKENYPAEVVGYRQAAVPPTEPRQGSADVIADEEIVLTPPQGCVRKDDPLNFTVELKGFEDDAAIDWNVSGPGSVNYSPQTGIFRTATFSSSIEGTATVEVSATGADGSPVTDDAIVNIGACDAKVYVFGQYDLVASAFDGYDEFSIDETVYPIEPLPPTRPAYWQGRTETNSANVTASGTKEYSDGNGGSASLSQSANASGQFNLAADADGVVDIKFDFSGSDECDNHPVGDTSQVDCSGVSSGAPAGMRFYVDITEAQSYMLHVDVSCARLGDSWGAGLLSAMFIRYDQAGNFIMPNGVPTADDPGQFIDGQLFGTTSVVNACDSSYEGNFSYTQQIDFVGPSTPGTTEEIVVQITLGAAAGNNHFAGFDLSDNFDVLYTGGVPVEPVVNLEPTAGSYTGSTTIDATVSFYPLTP